MKKAMKWWSSKDDYEKKMIWTGWFYGGSYEDADIEDMEYLYESEMSRIK